MANLKKAYFSTNKNGKETLYLEFEDMLGKRIRKTFSLEPILGTKYSAAQKESFKARMIMEYEKQERTFEKDIKLGRFMEDYLARKKEELVIDTYTSYEAMINGHIIPALGHLKLQELTPAHIDAFIRSLKKDGARKDGKSGSLDATSIKKIHGRLNNALKYAKKLKLITINPADEIELPKKKKKNADKIQTWTPEQIMQFLSTAKERKNQFYPFYLLVVNTGLRMGEALGLQWDDITLDEDKATAITVRRSIKHLKREHHIKPCKTESSNRSIEIDEETGLALATLNLKFREQRMALGDEFNKEGWVFYTRNGTPYNSGNLRRNFDLTIKHAKVPPIRFHDLRHTHASLLIASGMDIKTVSTRLGHAKVSTTMDIYTHDAPGKQKEASDSFAALLKNAQTITDSNKNTAKLIRIKM